MECQKRQRDPAERDRQRDRDRERVDVQIGHEGQPADRSGHENHERRLPAGRVEQHGRHRVGAGHARWRQIAREDHVRGGAAERNERRHRVPAQVRAHQPRPAHVVPKPAQQHLVIGRDQGKRPGLEKQRDCQPARIGVEHRVPGLAEIAVHESDVDRDQPQQEQRGGVRTVAQQRTGAWVRVTCDRHERRILVSPLCGRGRARRLRFSVLQVSYRHSAKP